MGLRRAFVCLHLYMGANFEQDTDWEILIQIQEYFKSKCYASTEIKQKKAFYEQPKERS